VTKEDFVFREHTRGSARLRWVSEYSEHRRPATRQRGFQRPLFEQCAPYTAEARMPPEDGHLEIIREAISLRAPT